MTHVTLSVVLVIVLQVFVCSTISDCNRNDPERLLLNNIEKLLNQRRLKIMNGITLTRKSDPKQTKFIERNASDCNSINKSKMMDINRKLRSILDSHVLEFDLASLLTEGNINSLMESDWCVYYYSWLQPFHKSRTFCLLSTARSSSLIFGALSSQFFIQMFFYCLFREN